MPEVCKQCLENPPVRNGLCEDCLIDQNFELTEHEHEED